MTGASFNTNGPTGSYVLDFIYDILLNAFAGSMSTSGNRLRSPGPHPGDQTVEFGSITETIDLPEIWLGPALNVLDLNSDTLGGTIEFPPPLDAFSVNFAWPNITTSGIIPA